MGLRFRKSVKIAPGIKLNFARKSHSVTFGGKGFHHTISSTGRRTTTAGIPGTGISYSTSSGGKKTKSKKGSESMSGSGNKSGGCLTIVLGFFAICLALAIYSCAWIPAIGFLIYFFLRKNTPDRKIKIGISSVVLITSLLLFACVEHKEELEKIEVSLPDSTFDINDSVKVTIKPVPDNAEIETVELSKNNIANFDYQNGIATITFKKTGKSKLKFVANGTIKSEPVTITVIDKEVKKKEEEKKKKEAEEKEKKEAEEAEKVEEEERKSQESVEQETYQESVQEEENQQTVVETQESTAEIVYWTESGKSYHSSQGCPTLSRSKNIYSGTIEQSRKTDPCDKCYY